MAMDRPASAPPWIAQAALLTWRVMATSMRNPVLVINLVLAIVFLLVYDGSLGGSPAVLGLVGGNYDNYILPAAVLAAAVAGGAAGLILVVDLQSRYFFRQLTMPIRRSALVAAVVVVGALQVALQTVAVIVAALLMGADPHTGVSGLLAIVAIALLWGLGFAGYSVIVGLITRDVQITAAAGFIFVPLVFMSPLLVPLDQLKPWMRTASSVNPASYVMGGMRTLMTAGWDTGRIAGALAASGCFALVTVLGAVLLIRRLTTRDL
jgi:ABC-type multidrug transport system permease subunit